MIDNQDLLRGLLHKDPAKRFTLEDVATHRWLTRDDAWPLNLEMSHYCESMLPHTVLSWTHHAAAQVIFTDQYVRSAQHRVLVAGS